MKESEKNFDDTKPKIIFSKSKIEEIRKKFNESRHKFFKSKINKIRINLYEIENAKNLSASKIKKIGKNLLKLEKNLSKSKKYYGYDDAEYKRIRDVKDLFDLLVDEDYYTPIITKGSFNNSYIQYESKGNKDKILTPSEYPYEYMDSWERFDKTSLPDKEDFYSSLNMEDITDVDYRHAKRVFKNLNNKNLGDYHDLYVQSDTLLLADVFEKFRNKCIEIYALYPSHFLSAPGLAWQA